MIQISENINNLQNFVKLLISVNLMKTVNIKLGRLAK
jgi:hypothetical protein